MFNGKNIAVILTVILLVVSAGFAQSLEQNWNDFLHYTKIGRLDLATGYAQVILQSSPNPVRLLALSEANGQSFEILLRVIEAAPDAELTRLSKEILDIIEQGIYIRRADPKVILQEIKRLSTTERGRLTAVERLKNAGEYAVRYMLDAMADNSRREELPNIVWALPQIGRDAIRPLVAALQTENSAVKAEIIKALGKIGYPQSLAYLKYIIEKDDSPELRKLAEQSIKQIDPAALKLSGATLFFRLAEKYYYHTESLAPPEEPAFANIWFWDPAGQRLVSEKIDKNYFNELMAMRACEWALKADPAFARAIGLWLAGYFKAEAAGIKTMLPAYFGPGHPDASVYATTAGPEYLHQALARAIRDQNAQVALSSVEALATTAGQKSLLYRIGLARPLIQALTFDDRAVRYSAAIAIAAAGPREGFAESNLVVESLAQALGQSAQQVTENTELWNEQLANIYTLRAARVMLKLARSRNPVFDLSAAQSTLISAINDKRPEIQILAGRILAHLDSPNAQRAVAAMALSSNNDLNVRILAFNSLATSAKLNANMLIEQMLDHIYALISSDKTDPELRSAAAAAYGALNLPSQKVKDLILDQARS